MIGDVILRRTILLGWLVEDKLGIIAITLSGLSNNTLFPKMSSYSVQEVKKVSKEARLSVEFLILYHLQ